MLYWVRVWKGYIAWRWLVTSFRYFLMEKTPIGWWQWGGGLLLSSQLITFRRREAAEKRASEAPQTQRHYLQTAQINEAPQMERQPSENSSRKPRSIQERPDQRRRGLAHLIPDQIAASQRRQVKVASKERTPGRWRWPSTFLGESVEREKSRTGREEDTGFDRLLWKPEKRIPKIKVFFLFFF